MKSRGLILGFSVSVMLILLGVSSILPVLAHLGSPVNSFWATTVPTINGTLAPGEWTDAAVRDFTMEMRSRTDGTLNKTLDGRFYVKNNYNNLYFAVQIFSDDYEATDFANNWQGLAILFEDNHDGTLAAGDNGEGVTTWIGSPFFAKHDLYYTGAFWDADQNAGKAENGSIAWSHTDPVQWHLGNWTFEMVIPLKGSDGDAYDFAITTLPATVGFKIWLQEPGKGTDGVYPDDPAITKNIQETTNGGTFGNLIIHPLYTLEIITTMGGTTNPAPAEYQHGYGTLVPVQALPNMGYMLDYWELDGFNVGAANPYTVTMNQNHTLKAYFKTKPAPVGGLTFSFPQKVKQGTLTSSLAGYGLLLATFAISLTIVRRKRK